MEKRQRVKEILDRECLEKLGKRCPRYRELKETDSTGKCRNATPCWTCHENVKLVAELMDAFEGVYA